MDSSVANAQLDDRDGEDDYEKDQCNSGRITHAVRSLVEVLEHQHDESPGGIQRSTVGHYVDLIECLK